MFVLPSGWLGVAAVPSVAPDGESVTDAPTDGSHPLDCLPCSTRRRFFFCCSVQRAHQNSLEWNTSFLYVVGQPASGGSSWDALVWSGLAWYFCPGLCRPDCLYWQRGSAPFMMRSRAVPADFPFSLCRALTTLDFVPSALSACCFAPLPFGRWVSAVCFF